MSVQDTITAAVEQSIIRVMTKQTAPKYKEQWDETIGDYIDIETGEVEEYERELGREYEGSNKQFARVIAEQLVENGDLEKGKLKWATKEITKALELYPSKVVNGREQNYYEGQDPESFARDLAGKIEHIFDGSDAGRGLIARLFGRR